jgi:hypothetical protein
MRFFGTLTVVLAVQKGGKLEGRRKVAPKQWENNGGNDQYIQCMFTSGGKNLR